MSDGMKSWEVRKEEMISLLITKFDNNSNLFFKFKNIHYIWQ